MRVFLFILLFLSCGNLILPQARAEGQDSKTDFSSLKHTGSGRVDQVIDGLSVLLKNKKIVRLSSLEIPDEDFSLAAKQALEKALPEGTEVILYQTLKAKKGRVNRMGHHLAHLVTKKDPVWINGLLLEKGLARTLPSESNAEMTPQMYAMEEKARRKNEGLWAKDKQPVLTAQNAAEGIGQYRLVEGTPLKAAVIRNNVYLNFGPDWKTDFSVMIAPPVRKQLARQGLDALSLAHRPLRVRGYLRAYNGPFMELEHPERLEIFEITDEQKKALTGTQIPNRLPFMARKTAYPDLFPHLTPYSTGFLDLSHGHQMYWEQSGNPDGVPVLFLHGGPGAGCAPSTGSFSIRKPTGLSSTTSAAPDALHRTAASNTTHACI